MLHNGTGINRMHHDLMTRRHKSICGYWPWAPSSYLRSRWPMTHRSATTCKSLHFICVNHSKGRPFTIVGFLEFSDQPTEPLGKLVADARILLAELASFELARIMA